MSRIAVYADRRFHRAHVKPARKRGRLRAVAWRLVRYGALAAVVVFAIYRASILLARAPLLQVDQIVVRGNHRMPSGEVLAALNGLRGENIVWTDLAAWRQRVIASPWVREATFRRSLPSTVEVVVAEREPIGIGRLKDRLYLVDEHGGIIDEYGPQYSDFDLPIIDGLAAPTGGEAGADPGTDAQRGDLAWRVILALRAKPAVAKRLSQVDVGDLHNASVMLNGDPAVIFVGEDRFLPRIESYLDLATTLRNRVADIDYVDLRFDDRIYVRPAGRPAKTTAVIKRTRR